MWATSTFLPIPTISHYVAIRCPVTSIVRLGGQCVRRHPSRADRLPEKFRKALYPFESRSSLVVDKRVPRIRYRSRYPFLKHGRRASVSHCAGANSPAENRQGHWSTPVWPVRISKKPDTILYWQGPWVNEMDAHSTISDVLRWHPQTMRVFIDHRMSCIGCAVAPFHTIEEACAEYRLAVEAIMRELADAVETETASPYR